MASEFEEHLHALQARGDVPDALLIRLTQARIDELEGELAAIRARRRRRDTDTAIDAHIRTAREVEILQEIEAGLEAMERWRADR